MRFTRLHINALAVLFIGTASAIVLVTLGENCLAGNLFAGSLGLAIGFAEKHNGD